jgi:amidase
MVMNGDRFEFDGPVEATISGIHAAYARGSLTAWKLTQMYLDRIAAYDQKGPMLNSIITVNPASLNQAAALDRAYQSSGLVGPLHGIPLIVKDNLNTKDMPTTGGSDALRHSTPPDDAFVIKKLVQAGAIIHAKSSMSEFAWGSIDTINSVLPGYVRNPYNTAYASGGSSGGTGAAISASFAVAGLGTDTGLSVRSPASTNCLVGLRPTLGLISCNGLIPVNADWDTVGPIARTARDLAIMLDVLAGYDPGDEHTAANQGNIPETYTRALEEGALNGMRIGVLRQAFLPEKADPEVIDLTERAVLDLRAAGAEVVDPLDIPEARETIQSVDWYKRFRHDLNGYLGTLGPDAPVKTLQDIIDSKKVHPFYLELLKSLQAWPHGLEDDPKLPEKREVERRMRTGFLRALEGSNLDAIVFPTFNYPPKRNGDRYTPAGSNNLYASVTGFPALVVPMGFVKAGLPVGLQFIGAPWSEPGLIRAGYGYEQATRHRRLPPTCPDFE